MNPNPLIKADILQNDPLILTIAAALSEQECQQLIARSERENAYDIATIQGRDGGETRLDIRHNWRWMVDDPQLAGWLFERLRPALPDQLNGWHLQGLNERLRFYRYDPGQTFRPHYDGGFERNVFESSQLTLLIYLNEAVQGGATRFYQDDPSLHASEDTLQYSIAPKTGRVLVFEHQQLHEGAPVESGRKYVLRTDVMYRWRG